MCDQNGLLGTSAYKRVLYGAEGLLDERLEADWGGTKDGVLTDLAERQTETDRKREGGKKKVAVYTKGCNIG